MSGNSAHQAGPSNGKASESPAAYPGSPGFRPPTSTRKDAKPNLAGPATSRASVACAACRKQKMKCEITPGENQPCRRCGLQNLECVFESPAGGIGGRTKSEFAERSVLSEVGAKVEIDQISVASQIERRGREAGRSREQQGECRRSNRAGSLQSARVASTSTSEAPLSNSATISRCDPSTTSDTSKPSDPSFRSHRLSDTLLHTPSSTSSFPFYSSSSAQSASTATATVARTAASLVSTTSSIQSTVAAHRPHRIVVELSQKRKREWT